jgi:hypothetical protein
VALGSDGSILVVGDFGGTVDFDPGTGADEHTAAGEGMSMFLSRFGPDGNFLMAKTWGSQGGSHRDFADRVATDPSGAAYVAGAFAGVLDTAGLDPSAQMPEAPGGNRDAYLLKFQLQPLPSRAETATKSLQKRISGPNWLATWGEASDSKSAVRAVADDTGSVYVVSSSSPADGSLNDVTSPGESGEKMTLTKFARDGSISWKRDWKLASVGIVNDLIDLDAHGNIYICGVFSGTVDFDPGPGRLDLTSSSDRSVFLLKLDSSGTLVHAAKGPEASILEMDVGDSGDIYLCGTFSGTVDFDPGPGVSELTASAFLQTIACCFDSTGGFKWVNAMPVSPMGPLQSSIGVDQSENLYILTYFTGTVDFDPGPGVDNHTAIPNRVYLCLTKFSPNGDHQWSRSWGQCGEVAVRVDGLGFAYVCGGFGGTVDFDPGPAFEVRTSETDQGAFMSKFSSQGDFLGVDTWTEVYLTSFLGFAVDSSGRGLLNESVLVFSTRRAESSSPVIDAQIRMIEQGKQEPVQHTWRWNLPDYSHINCIATDREGNIYLAGSLSGTMPIPFRDGAVQATSVGGYDAFLLKLDPERSEIAPPQ